MADFIDLEGRERLVRGLQVTLDDYLIRIPHLATLPVALDAAIDMSLRSAAVPGPVTFDTANRLANNFPEFAEAIWNAVILEQGLDAALKDGETVSGFQASLPIRFGPRLQSGAHRYELRSCLGSGAEGSVYMAADHLLSDGNNNALVAIKILHPITDNNARHRSFVDEAKMARRVRDPRVARVLDCGTDESGYDYIVYEYVDGGDLDAWLGEPGSRSLREIVALIAKLARGIHAAHLAGLVHCDIKPANILVSTTGEPKIVDFGIARRTEELSHRSPDLDPIGSLAFVAPEQFRADGNVISIATDIYALGGLLYYAITRNPPNGVTTTEIIAKLEGHVHHSSSSINSFLSWIELDLAQICQRALKMLPDDRYGSAAQFADDLEAWLSRRPIPWQHPGLCRCVAMYFIRTPRFMTTLIVTIIGLLFLLSGIYVNSTRFSRIEQQRDVLLLHYTELRKMLDQQNLDPK